MMYRYFGSLNVLLYINTTPSLCDSMFCRYMKFDDIIDGSVIVWIEEARKYVINFLQEKIINKIVNSYY